MNPNADQDKKRGEFLLERVKFYASLDRNHPYWSGGDFFIDEETAQSIQTFIAPEHVLFEEKGLVALEPLSVANAVQVYRANIGKNRRTEAYSILGEFLGNPYQSQTEPEHDVIKTAIAMRNAFKAQVENYQYLCTEAGYVIKRVGFLPWWRALQLGSVGEL